MKTLWAPRRPEEAHRCACRHGGGRRRRTPEKLPCPAYAGLLGEGIIPSPQERSWHMAGWMQERNGVGDMRAGDTRAGEGPLTNARTCATSRTCLLSQCQRDGMTKWRSGCPGVCHPRSPPRLVRLALPARRSKAAPRRPPAPGSRPDAIKTTGAPTLPSAVAGRPPTAVPCPLPSSSRPSRVAARTHFSHKKPNIPPPTKRPAVLLLLLLLL